MPIICFYHHYFVFSDLFIWLFLLISCKRFWYLIYIFDIDKKIIPKVANDVRLISGGKILENNKTIAQCKPPFGELPGGIITMHVVVQPSLVKAKTGNLHFIYFPGDMWKDYLHFIYLFLIYICISFFCFMRLVLWIGILLVDQMLKSMVFLKIRNNSLGLYPNSDIPYHFYGCKPGNFGWVEVH